MLRTRMQQVVSPTSADKRKLQKQKYERSPRGKRAKARAMRKWAGCNPISEGEIFDLMSKQEGRCALCGTELGYPDKNTCIDHNHLTGEVRGLLCSTCNRHLGFVENRPQFIEAARAYLKSPPFATLYV